MRFSNITDTENYLGFGKNTEMEIELIWNPDA